MTQPQHKTSPRPFKSVEFAVDLENPIELDVNFESVLRKKILEENLLVYLFTTVVSAVLMLFEPSPEWRFIGVAGAIAFMFVTLFVYWVCRRGRVQLSLYIYTVAVWLAHAVTIASFNEIYPYITVSIINLILLNGFIAGPTGALTVLIASSVLLLGSGSLGTLLPDHVIVTSTHYSNGVALLSTLVAGGFVVASGVRLQQRFLRRSVAVASALKEAQQILEKRHLRSTCLSKLSTLLLSVKDEEQILKPLLRELVALPGLISARAYGCLGETALVDGTVQSTDINIQSLLSDVASKEGSRLQSVRAHEGCFWMRLGDSDSTWGVLVVEVAEGESIDDDDALFVVAAVGIVTAGLNRAASERRLRTLERMETVGKLAGGVAHDFNNILATVVGTHDLVLSQLDKNHPAHERLSTSQVALYQARSLVNRLLTFAQARPSTVSVLDLVQVVRQQEPVMKLFMHHGVELIFVLPDAKLWVEADPVDIEQILLNLVVNARDALPDGGVVRIEVSQSAENHVEMMVADSGPGIPEALHSRVFEPFFTTKSEVGGTGLGLATVRSLSEATGGHVRLERSREGGAAVSITWPQVSSATTNSDVNQSENDKGLLKAHILVVDDDELVLETLEAMLQSFGLEVTSADCAQDALVHIEENQDIEMVLTDNTMPQMTGLELISSLREKGFEKNIVLMTGYGFVDAQGSTMPNAHIQKPVTLTVLRQVISSMLISNRV